MADNFYYVAVEYPSHDTGDEQDVGKIFEASVGAFPRENLVYAGNSLLDHGVLVLPPGEGPLYVSASHESRTAFSFNLVALYSNQAAADGFHKFLVGHLGQPNDFPVKKGTGSPVPSPY